MDKRTVRTGQYIISGRDAKPIVMVTITGDELDAMDQIRVVADIQDRYEESMAKIEARALPKVGAALDEDEEQTEVTVRPMIDETEVADCCDAIVAAVSRVNYGLDANKAIECASI